MKKESIFTVLLLFFKHITFFTAENSSGFNPTAYNPYCREKS